MFKDELPIEGLYFVLESSFHQWSSQSTKFGIRGRVTALDRYWFTNDKILESACAFTGTCVWSQSFCGGVNSVVDNFDLAFTKCEIALICHWVIVISENHCLLEVSIKF